MLLSILIRECECETVLCTESQLRSQTFLIGSLCELFSIVVYSVISNMYGSMVYLFTVS